MRRPLGTSLADSWYRAIVVVVAGPSTCRSESAASRSRTPRGTARMLPSAWQSPVTTGSAGPPGGSLRSRPARAHASVTPRHAPCTDPWKAPNGLLVPAGAVERCPAHVGAPVPDGGGDAGQRQHRRYQLGPRLGRVAGPPSPPGRRRACRGNYQGRRGRAATVRPAGAARRPGHRPRLGSGVPQARAGRAPPGTTPALGSGRWAWSTRVRGPLCSATFAEEAVEKNEKIVKTCPRA